MIKKLSNILFILVVIFLILLLNILILSRINIKKEDDIILPKNEMKYHVINVKKIDSYDMYNAYTLDISQNLNPENDEWFKSVIDNTYTVKFQYIKTKDDNSHINLFINDIKLENLEQYNELDKYKLYFYIFKNAIIIEHKKSDDSLSYVKIINKDNKEIINIVGEEDYYLNDITIDRYGLTSSFSRQSSKIETLVDNQITKFNFTLNNKEIVIDGCKKQSWDKDLINIDNVYYELNYYNNDNNLDIDNPTITNKQTLKQYIDPFKNIISKNCKIKG